MYFDEPRRPFDREIGIGRSAIIALATAFALLSVFALAGRSSPPAATAQSLIP